jgi:tetratricopeptide (TPR) repeat protein
MFAPMKRLRFAALVLTFAFTLCFAAGAKEEKWLRVNTEEFVLVTSLTEKEAAIWATEFSRYIGELRGLFDFKGKLPPLTVVIFARENAFADYRPLDAKGKPQEMAGFFLRDDSWAVAGLAGASASDEVRRTIFHEGVHWFLSGFDRQNPVWLEEGLAEVFSTFEVAKNKMTWGRPLPAHVSLLQYSRLMPTDQLLYEGRRTLFVDNSSHTGIVYAQSWATVHFLLYGQHKNIPRAALFDFMRLTREGMAIEAAFSQAVGSDIATFHTRLEEYLRGGNYYIRFRPLEKTVTLKAAPAAPLDVAQALGRLALAAGRAEKATAFARQVLHLVPDSPDGYELLAQCLKQNGDTAGALEAFSAAVERGSPNFQPYFQVALASHQAAVEKAGELTDLSATEARQIIDRYQRAILINPRMLAPYQNIAGLVRLAEPKSDDLKYLQLGRKIFPTDGLIQAGLAVLEEQSGNRVLALKMLDELQDDSNQPASVRSFARKLSDGWIYQEITGRIEQLAKEKKYSEALAYLEEQLPRATYALRSHLTLTRPRLRTSMRLMEIDDAMSTRRWADARGLLTETIESPDTPPHIKRQAQGNLEKLGRLGMKSSQP